MNNIEKEIIQARLTRLRVDIELTAKELESLNLDVEWRRETSHSLGSAALSLWELTTMLEHISDKEVEHVQISDTASLYA